MGRLTTLKPRLATLETRRALPLPKVADQFYKTKEWQEARDLAVAMAGGRCLCKGECGAQHHGGSCGRIPSRLFVDHIEELKDGGAPLAQSNLRPMCGGCHTGKTAKARAKRFGSGP